MWRESNFVSSCSAESLDSRKVRFALALLCYQGSAADCLFIHTFCVVATSLSPLAFVPLGEPQETTSLTCRSREGRGSTSTPASNAKKSCSRHSRLVLRLTRADLRLLGNFLFHHPLPPRFLVSRGALELLAQGLAAQCSS